MKNGDVIQVDVDDVAYGSQGVGRLDGRVVFVEGALPGECVDARVFKKKRDFAMARATSWYTKSPHRAIAPCKHFGTCGGCKWQNAEYEYQLELKQRIAAETIRRLGEFSGVPVHPTIPSPDKFAYRNKMEFSFSTKRWILPEEMDEPAKPVDFSLGLHVPGRFDKVLDIDKCLLQNDFCNEVLEIVKRFATESELPPWDTRSRSGFWRYLVMRIGKNTDQTMINIVTYEHNHDLMLDLKRRLLDSFPGITSFVNNVTTSSGGSAFGEVEYLLHGLSTIDEKLDNFVFSISANSFFQTNTAQALNLFTTAKEYSGISGNEIVFDLYSGAGVISILLSPFAKSVVGIELNPSAIKNARSNAILNKTSNCHFVQADLKDIGSEIGQEFGLPDIVVVDPPRAGLHPKAIQGILNMKPGRIVYVSCNPATFARDAKLICETDYQLIQVQPVDMFPHTYHIELVAQFELA